MSICVVFDTANRFPLLKCFSSEPVSKAAPTKRFQNLCATTEGSFSIYHDHRRRRLASARLTAYAVCIKPTIR